MNHISNDSLEIPPSGVWGQKILIITYYWPPAGGPGVQRWLKFVKYLPDFGFEPIVYLPENPSYPIIDENLLSEVSNQLVILRNKIVEPYQWASFLSKNKTKKISSGIIPNNKKQTFLDQVLLWIRGNVFIPDARVLWVKPSVKYLEKYLSENGITTIITSGPPHSLHLIGLELKQKLNVRWVADFRDPWTTIGYHKEFKLLEFAANKHKQLENKVLNNADLILVTSPSTRAEFKKITSKPIEVITNGFDVEKIGNQIVDKKFSLAHIGSFLSERNPRILWESISELIRENPLFASHFQLKLIGAISQEVLDSIALFQLQNYVNNLGYVSHDEAIVHQKKSQVLLLIEINSEDTKSIIPGKLFEYLVSERPIIGVGPKGCDFAEIIIDTNTGVFVDYSEKEKLKNYIANYFSLFLEGNLKSNGVGLQKYSRKNLTEKLANLLNRKTL
jgi:hypothetical protein